MKIWRNTDNRTKLGVAIYNYQEDGEERLALDIGDTVQILEESEDWFRGFCTKNRHKKGIFPRNYITVKEASVQINGSQEIVRSKEHPLVIELTNVVREWHLIWKQMYVERNKKFQEVQEMIQNLNDWRIKIIARKFTVDELKGMQQKVTALIDQGNAILELDLVVRGDQGYILDPEETSVIDIYKRHVEAAERVSKATRNRDSDIETRPSTWPSSFNLFVVLRNFVCKINEDTDILINLFDAREERFICENYLVNWWKRGVQHDIDQLNNYRVVFTDLGSKDRSREQVYLIFQIIRIGVMDPKDLENKKQTQGIRRPFGVAALDITDILHGGNTGSEDDQQFIPFQTCGEREFMYNVIKKVIAAKEINHKGQGLWVSLKVLQGDMKQVREKYPHLVVPKTALARKMGFPDVIMPGDVRNDIYLTLNQGEFTKGPTKTSDKNVEITMSVCGSNGEPLKDVISYGCMDTKVTEYKSMVYYHEDKPKWFEIVKVTISIEAEFKDLHLKFIFRHKSSAEAKDKSERPFAMSFIRLMNDNGTTLQDRLHELLVYKIESKKFDEAKVYLNLPSCKQDLDPSATAATQKQSTTGLLLSSKDCLYISSYVCSTKLTHNVDLLGLLKWHEVLDDNKSLRKYLERLMREEGEEIVKFLQDLLDSLFNILMQHKNNELCDNLVFDALVYIVVLISDRKYLQFRPVLDAYIDSSFSFAMAYNKLMVILKDYVDKANEKAKQSESLLPALKSLEYIFKFIIKSRCLFSMINEGRGKQQFEISLKQLLTAINNMMVYRTDNTLLTQGAALKYISCIVSEVMTVFDPVELSRLLVQLIDNVPSERLTKQKMKCIDQIIQTKLFDLSHCRQILLPAFLQHTHELMLQNNEIEDCVSILSHIMDRLWKSENPNELDMKIIMNKVLRTVIQSVVGMEQPTKQVQFFGHQPPPVSVVPIETLNGNCVSVLISILRQMTESDYQDYIQSFPTHFDVKDFLMEILCVFKDLVNRKVYQQDWLEMVMMQNSVILRALRFFASTIYERYSKPFDYQVWDNFFHCAIAFLTQDCLQLENFSPSKRQKIISRYKDMRRETSFEIRSMWFKLGANKINFIPFLVGQILEMTLIPEIELRKATIPIFFDMMQHEFTQYIPNSDHIQGNFHEFENEMITQLDNLIEGGRGDEQYMELFTEILTNLCEKNEMMREQGLQFVDTVHGLLERLLVYRTIIQDEIREHRMSCIVNLLDFYHDINRQEMYIRYLGKLSDLHLGCDNFTEAAHTLLLYTKLLQWSNEPLPPMLMNLKKYPEAQTHQMLKEKLYYEIVSYFEKGKMWEKGIDLCEELCDLYKLELFDYNKIAKSLKKQATLYESIMAEKRPEPEYFRVGYFGQGFPSFLQNKVFIYRGKEYERLADFNGRMQNLFPNAMLMKTLDNPSQEFLESDKQYLQINAVSPVMEHRECFQDRDISEPILRYYRWNEVQTFTYSRRSEESSHDVMNMWLERTIMKTSDPFPGIVGWYAVVETVMESVSPLENAIETMKEKNKNLSNLIEEHQIDRKLNVSSLSMALKGIVAAEVMGGISNYKDFFMGDFDPDLQEKLREATVEQMTYVREGLLVHKKNAPQNLQPLQVHMEESFSSLCNMIETEYGIKVADKAFTSATLRRNQSLPGSTNNRVSDLSITSLNLPSELRPYKTLRSSLSNVSTPRNHATRSQSVWVKDKSNSSSATSKTSSSSKVSLSTLKKRVSQVTEVSLRNSVESSPIELSEQLTPKRPPRPDTERRPSRPPSTQMRFDDLNKNSSSMNSLSSSHSGGNVGSRLSGASDFDGVTEEPPPLPDKQNHPDIGQSMDFVRKGSSASLGSRSSKPAPPLPPSLDDDETPPPVPPKPSAH